MSKIATRPCRECSRAMAATLKPGALFCSNGCRVEWNNRRKTRGAELYDLFMAYRYQRGVAKALGLWSLICRMASIWNEEDKRLGRQTYADPEIAKARALAYTASRLS